MWETALTEWNTAVGWLQQHPWALVALSLALSLMFAGAAGRLVGPVATWLSGKLGMPLDKRLIRHLRSAIRVTVVLAGMALATEGLELPELFTRIFVDGLQATVVVLWSLVVVRAASDFMEFTVERRAGDSLSARALPMFQVALRITVASLAIYFLLTSWGVEATAWVASAGVVGVVLGLAAQETVGNLFAGLSLLTDAPFSLGDVLVVEGDIRGRVAEVGLRSTRLISMDGAELVIPNSLMGRATLVNISSGQNTYERVDVPFQVAYGTFIADVDGPLSQALGTIDHVLADGDKYAPVVMCTGLGADGIDLIARVWVDTPLAREKVLDQVVRVVLDTLHELQVDIPFPQRTLHLPAQVAVTSRAVPSETSSMPAVP